MGFMGRSSESESREFEVRLSDHLDGLYRSALSDRKADAGDLVLGAMLRACERSTSPVKCRRARHGRPNLPGSQRATSRYPATSKRTASLLGLRRLWTVTSKECLTEKHCWSGAQHARAS